MNCRQGESSPYEQNRSINVQSIQRLVSGIHGVNSSTELPAHGLARMPLHVSVTVEVISPAAVAVSDLGTNRGVQVAGIAQYSIIQVFTVTDYHGRRRRRDIGKRHVLTRKSSNAVVTKVHIVPSIAEHF